MSTGAEAVEARPPTTSNGIKGRLNLLLRWLEEAKPDMTDAFLWRSCRFTFVHACFTVERAATVTESNLQSPLKSHNGQPRNPPFTLSSSPPSEGGGIRAHRLPLDQFPSQRYS